MVCEEDNLCTKPCSVGDSAAFSLTPAVAVTCRLSRLFHGKASVGSTV